VIRDTERLREFERWYTQTRTSQRSFADALALFQGLWAEARTLNPDFPSAWIDDIVPHHELARVLNGLPEDT
jgi:hypothetical protein